MAEIKRLVRPVEVNYLCDACGKGMMTKVGDMDPGTGAIEHRCMICNASQTFYWNSYPRIDHVGEDESI